MNELLRFTATGQNGPLVFLQPKFEFVFYERKMEMYKKGKLERTINYEDIKEVVVMKNWQNNIFINCNPIGVNIYKVSDEICNKIKEITSNKKDDNNYSKKVEQTIKRDEFERNNFIKIEKDKKIIVKTYTKNSIINSFEFKFQTNVINSIPETNIKFAIALEQDNNEYFNFFINIFNPFIQNCDSPTRTYFPGLTDTHNFFRYRFNYKQQQMLKIGIDENSYLEISVI